MMAHGPPSSSPQSLAELPLGAPRPARQCADVCLDLLLAEAVRVYNSSDSAGAPSSTTKSEVDASAEAARAAAGTAAAAATRPPRVITPAPVALEAAGVRVGRAFAERLCRGASNAAAGSAAAAAAAASRPRPPGDALDAVKFVCKEFWTAAFRKQVDALRTNHRGTFVLHDNAFWPIMYLALPLPGAALGAHGGAADAAAADANAANAVADAAEQRRRARAEAAARAAQPHLWFPCGVIRGALAQLGVECTVEADARALPACTFTVKILG